ncbi:MAG TPA: hypothetical protein VN829_16055, partial [Dongiaceae bacterium]|nr:hypothetical protein [Dongiaceae bacterium]
AAGGLPDGALMRAQSGVRRQSEAATALSAPGDIQERQPRSKPKRCRAPLATALQSGLPDRP